MGTDVTPHEALSRLARSAALAGRPDVVVLDRDLPALGLPPGEAHGLVERLERSGRIRRVRRGAYVLVEPTGNVQADVLDVVAAVTPGPYLITGGRALELHGLTDQHFRRIDVLVARPLRSWSWRGDEVRYTVAATSLRGGARRVRRTRARVAAPERAIADSLRHPSWGVTLAQVVEALDELLRRDPDAADRLAADAARQGSHALACRLGLLVTHVAGADPARAFLPLRGSSNASVPLLPGGPSEGPIDSTWRVRVNVDPERLLQHRQVG